MFGLLCTQRLRLQIVFSVALLCHQHRPESHICLAKPTTSRVQREKKRRKATVEISVLRVMVVMVVVMVVMMVVVCGVKSGLARPLAGR